MAKIFFKKLINYAVLAFKYLVNTVDKNINPEKAMREIVKNK